MSMRGKKENLREKGKIHTPTKLSAVRIPMKNNSRYIETILMLEIEMKTTN